MDPRKYYPSQDNYPPSEAQNYSMPKKQLNLPQYSNRTSEISPGKITSFLKFLLNFETLHSAILNLHKIVITFA